ncbi:MAG: alpha-amylase family protein [Dysgonamonadaceae bacterium]|jgi:glycosidase|nr:alpha-amylase family protein [Dysgonamonadaceae bacterium]
MSKIIIYQIFTRLFGNTKTANIHGGNMEENGVGKMSAFTPKVLMEIRKMGFTHVWYTGLLEHATQTDYPDYGIRKNHPAIVKGKAGSPYAIRDYYDIDPDLADNIPSRMAEFEDLVARTHQAGLKMIIDFVPNHVARQYYSDAKPDKTVDLGANDDIRTTFSPCNNFYYIPGQVFAPSFELVPEEKAYSEFPAKVTGNDCFTAHPNKNDWYETIKLNYGIDYLNGKQAHFEPIPDTWHKMCDILLFWASKNIDVFRCDMAEMVPVEFWCWAIRMVKQAYPNVQFIAEIYNPDQYRNYLWNGKFDYLYDKVGLYDTLRNIVCNRQAAQAITGCWQAVGDIQEQMLYFLENHDEQRIASSFFAGDPWKAIPAFVVMAAMHKNPVMIYFGQELGEKGMDAEGFSGLDGRTTIFDYWSVDSLRNWYNSGKIDVELLTGEQKTLRDFYIRMLTLCNDSDAICEGKFFDLMYVNPHSDCFNPDKQYAFMRYAGSELLLIVANFDESDVDAGVFLPAAAFDYFGIDETEIISAKDLLSDEKMKAKIGRDSRYFVHLAKTSACIIRFFLK